MILLIGDAPSACTDPGQAFKGAKCEQRLLQWVDYIRGHEWYIIINRVEPDFNVYVAMAVAEGDPIVALGQNASKALYDIPHYKLPHPSGVNRQLNDIGFIRQKLDECKEFVQKASRTSAKAR